MMENNTPQTDFGYIKVPVSQKENLVQSIFSKVANKYNLMNDLMSLGVHRVWKKKLCDQILNYNSTILDAACGSGDLSFELYDRSQRQNKSSNIIMLDLNQEMLDQAQKRAFDNNKLANIRFICANLEEIPLNDQSVDYYIIGFGIRNVTNIDKALKEAYRVLKPGGKFLCLEFAKIDNTILQFLYNFYSFNIIPKIGSLITNQKDAYEYLVQSIDLFPSQDEFRQKIQAAGFNMCKYQNLSFGIAAIYSAYKLL